RAGRAWSGLRPGGGIHVPARVRPDQPGQAGPGPRLMAVDQGVAGQRPAGDRGRRRNRPWGEGLRMARPRTWSRRWRTASARSSGRSPWTPGRTRSPRSGDLLKAFIDVARAVITIDALHMQHDTAQTITGRHADYVMTVKG